MFKYALRKEPTKTETKLNGKKKNKKDTMNLGLNIKEIENAKVFIIIEDKDSPVSTIKGRIRIYEQVIAAIVIDNKIKRIIIPILLERISSWMRKLEKK